MIEREYRIVTNALKRKVTKVAVSSISDLLNELLTSFSGLDKETVSTNRSLYGTNRIKREKKKSIVWAFFSSFINPFTIMLFVLAVISSMTDIVFPRLSIFGMKKEDSNVMTVVIIMSMIIISGTLRFIEEKKSSSATEKLLNMITTTCTVTRIGHEMARIAMDYLVVGDIVHLSAGDMVPADIRIIEAKDFFLSQSALTGESYPVEKTSATSRKKESITDYQNIAFMASNVISGSADGVVISTGDNTLLGSLSSAIDGEKVETNFTKGVNSVPKLLIRFSLVIVPLVFVINGLTKGDWLDAFLFGVSIAVGLTPKMLPMIVTTCLAKGAVAMSRKNTVVKKLNSIQNFGAIDVLCTDKTETLTKNKVVLEYHLNVNGEEDGRVLRLVYLNSYFQTRYKNLMDEAVIRKTEEVENADPRLLDLSENYVKVDEIPFDFARRRITTVVEDKMGKTMMVTKGAVEEMLSICSYVECDGEVQPLTESIKDRITDTISSFNGKGFRVLAVAEKNNTSPVETFGINDECDMVLIGYIAFLDPPKESSKDAIQALKKHGVTTKILTGDNDKVTHNR